MTGARRRRGDASPFQPVGGRRRRAVASASALHAQTVIPYTNGQNRAAPIVLVDPAGTVLTVIVGAATQSGEISGGPLLTFAKSGAGTLTLTNANINLFADVSINAGTLAITNSTALGQGLVTLNGGALQAAANGLNVGNDFAINTAGGTIDTNGKTLTILGDIFDGNGPGGALTKIGAGTLILDGFNDYSGATNILQGGVLATDDFALSENSAFRVNKGASLELDDGVDAAIGSLADGPLGGGSVTIGAADFSTFLHIGLDDKDTTFSGVITGAGSLEKTGAGIQTLTGKGSSIGGILSICDCSGDGGLDIAGGSFKAGLAVFVLDSLLSVTKGGVLEQTNPFGYSEPRLRQAARRRHRIESRRIGPDHDRWLCRRRRPGDSKRRQDGQQGRRRRLSVRRKCSVGACDRRRLHLDRRQRPLHWLLLQPGHADHRRWRPRQFDRLHADRCRQHAQSRPWRPCRHDRHQGDRERRRHQG